MGLSPQTTILGGLHMIYEKYVKETKNSQAQNLDINLDLIYSIFKTQSELLNATNNYEYAEGDLIDYYSYHIKATKSKLNYLLKNAKSRGIVIDHLKQIELKSSENSEVV